ncbi:MAG: ATP-binding cassette domain-containing protein [Actinomycetota bacterium]
MTGQPKLSIENCSLTFNPGEHNEVRALNDISLQIQPAQHLVIVGSNGAGKSTLLNLVCGRHQPDTGRVFFDGVDVTDRAEHQRARRIGRVFQDPLAGTAAPMTIVENLALAERRSLGRRLRRIGRNDSDHYREQLARLGMGLEDRLSNHVGSLSGGQRQALALLMATLSEPDLLVLDEHTAALDPGAAERVLQLTNEFVADEGLTALMITHNMDHATDTGDRTVMMHRGQVLFDIEGEERGATSVADLIARFRELGGTLSDRTALS